MTDLALACALAIATWYGGGGDGYLGQPHAAYWNDATPQGWPQVVTTTHMGCAANDYPFGTRLKITRIWAIQGPASEYDGRSVICTVMDRIGRPGNGGAHVDLWPRAAEALGFGPSFGMADAGVLSVLVEVVEDHDCFRWRSDHARTRL